MRQVTRRGDTLIEVMMSISVFSMVALLTINMMNGGINTAQRTLEYEMARNEIDAQAEALRFIHNGFVSERQKATGEGEFSDIWSDIIDNAVRPSQTEDGKSLINDDENTGGSSFNINNMNSCDDAYGSDSQKHLNRYSAFILNTRLMIPNLAKNFSYLNRKYSEGEDNLMKNMVVHYTVDNGKKIMNPPSLYPRLIYKKLKTDTADTCQNTDSDCARLDEGGALYNAIDSAEGIWINAVGNNEYMVRRSDYFDFYIRTCWQSTGSNAPSTITTVVRLYNTEIME